MWKLVSYAAVLFLLISPFLPGPGARASYTFASDVSRAASTLSEVDQPPRIIRKVDPVYPFAAKRGNVQGDVTLRFIITRDGKVTDASIVKSSPAGVFDSSALKAIEKWQFEPATKDGKTVDVIIIAPLKFQLVAPQNRKPVNDGMDHGSRSIDNLEKSSGPPSPIDNGATGGGFGAFIPLIVMFLVLIWIMKANIGIKATKTDAQRDIATGPSFDRDILFSDSKATHRKGIERRQTILLRKVHFLKDVLKDDERIILITTGCSPTSIVEQLFLGWIFIYLKRSLLVFTNRRLLHIPTGSNYSYRSSVAQILYSGCNSIQVKGRTLVVEYRSEKREKFYYTGSKEKKKIRALLSAISFQGSAAKFQDRIHLCPRCTRELEEGKYTCSNCRLEFKDEDEARRISIIYPGGGYFYTGHPFLGAIDAFVETILLINVVLLLIGAIKGTDGSVASLCVFAVLLAFEKLISVYHSNRFIKEYIPKEKDVKVSS